MRFKNLIAENEAIQLTGPQDMEIKGLTYRSQDVKPGWLFAAIPGAKTDGHQFVPQAIRSGAVALIVQKAPAISTNGLAVALVRDSRKALAHAADRYFGSPSRGMVVVGITGTNGKTTTAFLLESIFREAGRKPAVIGTVNYRLGDLVRPAPVTTPESVDLQGMLAEMKSMGADCAAIEVSSHALHQGRVWGLRFAARVFTNLSRDHLDYHRDMDDYFDAKSLLFHDPEFADSGPAVINADDPWGARLLRSLGPEAISYGIEAEGASVRAIEWKSDEKGITGRLATPRGELKLKSALLGRVNLYNILAAAAASEAVGIDHMALKRGVESLKTVPGRLEPAPNSKGITVLVDYSHTPDALEKAMDTVREFTKGKLIVVFGCGGDRDRGKRPIMGKLAAEKADVAVVTSDNPRSEKPLDIISEILKGVLETESKKVELSSYRGEHGVFWIEPDRKKAIFGAISIARKGDTVLIAGKGHEDYQIIGKERTHFDDREVAREALGK